MENIIDAKYKIDLDIIKNYVNAVNSITEPMSKIKLQMMNFSNSFQPVYNYIFSLSEEIKKLSNIYPNEKTKIFTNLIRQIMEINNGVISSRLIEPLEISRQYISNLEKNNEIEKVTRGIYISSDVFEDSFYSFQLKYKKAIFSHMNALYFYGMTEEIPYNYTVTVSQSYHVSTVNEKCNVFYVDDSIISLGLCEIKTSNGNKVRIYDLERSICDIIRSKNRMDLEQVKKTIKQYMNSKDKNINKLSDYSERMGIKEQVMEMVGMF